MILSVEDDDAGDPDDLEPSLLGDFGKPFRLDLSRTTESDIGFREMRREWEAGPGFQRRRWGT